MRDESWAVIIAAVIFISVGAAIFWISFQSPSGPDCTDYSGGAGGPIPVQITWSSMTLKVNGTNHWYHTSVTWALPGLTLKNLEFQVDPGDGVAVPAGSAWEVVALNSSDSVIDHYSTNASSPGTWTTLDSSSIVAGVSISLLTTPGNVSNDQWDTIQVGTAQNGCSIHSTTTVPLT
jgi:hypothetical protein